MQEPFAQILKFCSSIKKIRIKKESLSTIEMQVVRIFRAVVNLYSIRYSSVEGGLKKCILCFCTCVLICLVLFPYLKVLVFWLGP